MAALEGAEAARATATGMAAVTASLLGQLRAGDAPLPNGAGQLGLPLGWTVGGGIRRPSCLRRAVFQGDNPDRFQLPQPSVAGRHLPRDDRLG
jgi:hypothetical protein